MAELMALPGVGRRRAEAIVLHRLRHGPPRSVADLQAVDGLGPVTAAALAPWLGFGPDQASSSRQSR